MLLDALLGSATAQEEQTPAGEDETIPTALEPAVEPSPAITLKAKLGDPPLLRVVDEQLHWGAADQSLVIAEEAVGGSVAINSDGGVIFVHRRYIGEADPDRSRQVAQLIDVARQAGLAPETRLTYDESILTGHRLRGEGILVLQEGLLRQQEATPRNAELVQAIEQAGAAILSDLGTDHFTSLSLQNIREVITQAAKPPLLDGDGTEITPQFARRLIRHGWLERVIGDRADTAALVAAVQAAQMQLPRLHYQGPGGELVELGHQWGPSGWLLQTEQRSVMGLPPPMPEYHQPAIDLLLPDGDRATSLLTVIELPPGSDPRQDPEVLTKATKVGLFHRRLPLAWWSDTEGFGSDTTSWRRYFPAVGDRVAKHAVGDFFPPHLVLKDFHGDLHGIISQGGLLAAPKGRDAEAGETFLAAAAATLTDAAHLDLVGQYFFKYIYDSPDSRVPLLPGTQDNNGDIHQTALETLATAVGGRCRGDCDDIAEFYQNILIRQGRTAHVVSLPGHAAVAWAEQKDQNWHTYILQTGPALEFSAPTLQQSLEQAYKRFDESATFDPNGVGLLLRFSGENTRSGWQLSYRIFSEPDYARTMIDVQRDWHFQTYLEGIEKMEELIAKGDEDTANYRELAGLFRSTGQWAKAAEYMAIGIERTPEASSRLFESSEYIDYLLQAGKRSEAEQAIAQVLDEQLPALREQLGDSAISFGLRLASNLLDNEAPDLASEVLAAAVDAPMQEILDKVDVWLDTRYEERIWRGSRTLGYWRRLLLRYQVLMLEQLRQQAIQDEPFDADLRQRYKFLQRYFDKVQLFEPEEAWELLQAYANLGAFYCAILGEDQVLAQLRSTASPTQADSRRIDHQDRLGGIVQPQLDLPWIRLSPLFYTARLMWYVDTPEQALPRERLVELDRERERARIESKALGYDGAFIYRRNHSAALLAAVLLEQEDRLRALLREVKERDDKRLRDEAASTLGAVAGRCSKDWFDTVLQVWVEELDYKPKYFLIAWQARLHDAPERALQAAALAAERFADDPAFVNEYRFMQELFAEEAKTGPSD